MARDRADVSEIEVTPEMRSAGEAAFDAVFGSYGTRDLVEAVYNAMRPLERVKKPRVLREAHRPKPSQLDGIRS